MSKRHHHKSRSTIDRSRSKLTDEGALDVVREVGEHRDIEEVNFSQNSLTSKGLEAVVDLCVRCNKLRVVKLFKNRLDDLAVEGLSRICKSCPNIEEMHLSHNQLTDKGIRDLVTAAEASRPENSNPLWLRIEQNYVSDPHSVFNELNRHLSLCDRKDERRCNVRTCAYGKKVHLPFFKNQHRARGQGWRKDQQWHERDDYHDREDYHRDREDYQEEQGDQRSQRNQRHRDSGAVILTARSDVDTQDRHQDDHEERDGRKQREDPRWCRNGERSKRDRRRELPEEEDRSGRHHSQHGVLAIEDQRPASPERPAGRSERQRRREAPIDDRRMPAPDRHRPLAIEDRPPASDC